VKPKKFGRGKSATCCPIFLRCSLCKEELLVDNFYILKNRGDKKGKKDILKNHRASRCKECQRQEYLKTDQRMKLYYAAKGRASQRNVAFSITPEDIVIPEFCPVLGMKLIPKIGGGPLSSRVNPDAPTVDRIDNDRGYEPGNVAVISLRANVLKSNGTVPEFEKVVKYMKSHGL
jgi:hypothetical protein